MERTVYQALASRITAIENCKVTGNAEWEAKHRDAIRTMVDAHMPSGSGIDNGVTFCEELSHGNRLVFSTAFHHMDENGMYDSWTEHTVTVRPSLAFGIEVSISGRNRNDIKDYLAEEFTSALTAIVTE